MKLFVYLVVNKINGKKYIGKHKGHENDKYIGSGNILKKAIRKYGKEQFLKIVLEYADTEQQLDQLEMDYIQRFNAVSRKDFYNVADGGTGGNTLKNLPKEVLDDRSRKIKEYFRTLPDEIKEEQKRTRSESMKLIRKDKFIEEHRIAAFKKRMKSKTLAEKAKQYESRSGTNAYQARKVETPLGQFGCAKHAAIAHKVCVQTIINRCKRMDAGWRFLDDGFNKHFI